MTDNEIIKGLECCINCDCKNCPFYEESMKTCKDGEVDTELVLDLINRLKTNDEKNENVIRLAEKTIEKQSKEIEEQQAEIERLQKDKADIISAVEYRINQAKESAYKEFAEQLQSMLGDPFLREHNDVCVVIDKILADLTPNLTKIPHSSLCETETYEGVTDTNVGGKKNDFKE